MQTISVQPLQNQTLQTQVNNQAVTLSISQSLYGLFMTVSLGTTVIIASVICQNLNRIVRDVYLGFSGDFIFVDTQGTSSPVYTGLGSRWQLVYLSPTDLTNFGLTG
jgi:hypothetical protein